ncbi:MAG: HAMP domain-containing protein [Desulfosarcinaceae bacterium]|nr:HAMP domain-containing protein [Desulfosarcinaceae bacterium]
MGGSRLIWKLLGIIACVIALLMGLVWLAVDYLAADYFSVLMEKYHISPESSHAMFVEAIHAYLIWASLGGVLIAGVLSFWLLRRALGPLTAMTASTRRISSGDYTARVPVHSGDEVGQLAQAFNRMAGSLERLEGLRRELMIDIAHELRTPLTNMRGYLEALVDGVLPPTAENFRLLETDTLRIVHLTEDILKLAKADAARQDLAPVHLFVAELIATELKQIRQRFQAKGITVTHSVAKEAAIEADPHMLGQVVRNLLENACRYTPQGGWTHIVSMPATDQLTLKFSNSVDGFDAGALPFLFERFYRGERSRSRAHGGAGIGLAIVKELVEAHGGTVTALYEDAVFTIQVCLPCSLPAPKTS